MITLKDYNSYDDGTRRRIIKTVLGDHWLNTALVEPYRHNFDYDANGAKLKSVLACCNKQKDGSINIVINFMPKVAQSAPTTAKTKPTKKVAKKTPSEPLQRKKYKFRRYTEEDPDDGEWVWAWGYTEEEARQEIQHDYWNTTRLDFYGIMD